MRRCQSPRPAAYLARDDYDDGRLHRPILPCVYIQPGGVPAGGSFFVDDSLVVVLLGVELGADDIGEASEISGRSRLAVGQGQ